MQAVESQTLILYHTDLRGEWPEAPAQALAARLPYAKRLEVAARAACAQATLAGVALALRALGAVAGRVLGAADLAFPQGGKPRLRAAQNDGPDFSISHSGPWVGCAVVAQGLVGFDIEFGSDARLRSWAAREAALKACSLGLVAAGEVQLHEGRATCLGRVLHALPLGLFPGAAACLMTSLAVRHVETRALPLGELFAP